MRFLSLAPACHCFKPRGTPRQDVKFKCLSLGHAFRAFLKRHRVRNLRKREHVFRRMVSLEDSNTEAKDNSAMAYCIPYFELAGHEIEPESKQTESNSHLTPSAVTLVLPRSKLYSFGIPKFLNSSMDSSLTPLLDEMSKMTRLWCHCVGRKKREKYCDNN